MKYSCYDMRFLNERFRSAGSFNVCSGRMMHFAVVIVFAALHVGAADTIGLDALTITNAAPITMRLLTQTDFDRALVLSRIEFDKQHDFEMPPGACCSREWRMFGAFEDWMFLQFTNHTFNINGSVFDTVRVSAGGELSAIVRTENGDIKEDMLFAPLKTSLGIVPEYAWPNLNQLNRPVLFWYDLSRIDSVVLTWQNVLRERLSDNPVSVQAEIFTDGRLVYRYDLSRLNNDTVSNVLIGAKYCASPLFIKSLPRSTVEMEFSPLYDEDKRNRDFDGDSLTTLEELFVYHTDAHNADTDNDGLEDGDEILVHKTDPKNPFSLYSDFTDGFAVKLEGVNPYAVPPFSTNMVWEHVFYSGMNDGGFHYPVSNMEYAVMKVMVSGKGGGMLKIDDRVIPLFAPPKASEVVVPIVQHRSSVVLQASERASALSQAATAFNVTNTFLVAVKRGKKKRLWWSKPEELNIVIESNDFVIGELPTGLCPFGWIAFPHIDVTPACIHDHTENNVRVSLVHGIEFPGQTVKWVSEDEDVRVYNAENSAFSNRDADWAVIEGSFKRNENRRVKYILDHPKRLNRSAPQYEQPVTYCPPYSHDDEELNAKSSSSGLYQPHGEFCECIPDQRCECDEKTRCYCVCWFCDCSAYKTVDLEASDYHIKRAFEYIVSSNVCRQSNVLYLYHDNRKEMNLYVPKEYRPRCCPCSSHSYSNSVSCAVYTGNVKVKDENGVEFNSSGDDCKVTVEGMHPSYDFDDSRVMFMTNCGVYRVEDYTVLGVAIDTAEYGAFDLRDKLSLPDILPIDSRRGEEHLCEINLVYSVKLRDGFVRIAIEDLDGDVEIWLRERYDDNGIMQQPVLLLSKQRPERYFRVAQWMALLERYGRTDSLMVRVRALNKCSFTFAFEYAWQRDANTVHDYCRQKYKVVSPVLNFDYDRNGKIDDYDNGCYRENKNVYFWHNDSRWTDDDAFTFGYGRNVDNNQIDGRHDLLNFIPIAVDLSELEECWGDKEIEYVIEMTSGDPKYAFADVSMDNMKSVHLGDCTDLKGTPIYNAKLEKTGKPLKLSDEFIALAKNKSGAMIMEFSERNPNFNIWLYAREKEFNSIMYRTRVNVHVGNIADMISWINIRGAAGGTGGIPTVLDTYDWPKSERKDGSLVFVHGYNMVEGEETALWAMDVFRKMWWSGLEHGFVAVQWYGNKGQIIESITPDYYENVKNAFLSAESLSAIMRYVSGPKWFLAHSLGNMLVSAAIQDYGMEYEKYFMLNAAVAIEAYKPDVKNIKEIRDNMTPSKWIDYPLRVRAAHWYDLFDKGDGRRLLTWKGRFKDVTKIVNFYSSEEEVLKNGDGTYRNPATRKYAWYNQERNKGSWLMTSHPDEAGWGFNEEYDTLYKIFYDLEYLKYNGKMPPQRTYEVSDAMLKVKPFFLDFKNKDIYSSENGKIISTNYAYRAELLAFAIPAESYAVGANPLPDYSELRDKENFFEIYQNYNMAQFFVSGRDEIDGDPEWVHSTFVQRPFKRVHELFSIIDKHMKEK